MGHRERRARWEQMVTIVENALDERIEHALQRRA
jgi:hypothetical protein